MYEKDAELGYLCSARRVFLLEAQDEPFLSEVVEILRKTYVVCNFQHTNGRLEKMSLKVESGGDRLQQLTFSGGATGLHAFFTTFIFFFCASRSSCR